MVKIKANSKYICQQCGGTENIQAHHEIPGDDSSLICLCAECHSQRHPNMPKALFFNKRLQPYWHNKSASALAREWGIHPQTIIRAAKKLGIQSGELSSWDEQLILLNIPKLQYKKPKKRKYYQTIEERNRKILKLWRGGEGWLIRQIAKKFNMSWGAVQMVIHRARQKEKVLVEQK